MPYISDYKPLFPETGLFERSITTSVYKNILQNYEDNSEDLQYIEDIIEILQYYIFEGKNEIVDEMNILMTRYFPIKNRQHC